MIDNQHPLQAVLSTLCTPARADGRAPVIAVTSAHAQLGSSYVARNLALLAAQYYVDFGQRVALVDLDLATQAQFGFFNTPLQQSVFGPLSAPYDATFGVTPFWQVSPDNLNADGTRMASARYGALHLVGDTGLAITRFNWDEVKDGQAVHIAAARDYWQALRDQFAVVIIDTPSFETADTALTVVPEADKTIIVCDTARGGDPAQKALSDKISDAGGRCVGMVINEGAYREQPQQRG